MFCTCCGVSLEDSARYCSQCGSPVAANAYSVPPAYPKLSRPREDRKIAGVCAGFARYWGVDVTLVRLLAVVLIFWPIGIGLIGYIVAWIVMPNDPLRLEAASTAQPANGHA